MERTTGKRQCDALADGWTDVQALMKPVYKETDEEKKKLLIEHLTKDTIEPFLARYEKFLTENGGNYFVGENVTWVDLLLAHSFRQLEGKFSNAFENHKKILQFAENIERIPQIKKWIEFRAKTDH